MINESNNNKKQIVNYWTTLTEINTSHFNIQRSVDGRNFRTVGTIAAKGNSDYSFPDIIEANSAVKTYYYRIESVDNDGAKQYTSTKQIRLDEATNQSIKVFPNPAHKDFVVSHSAAQKNTVIKIVDETGKICSVTIAKEGATSTTIIASKLSKGNYTVLLIDDNIKIASSIIIL